MKLHDRLPRFDAFFDGLPRPSALCKLSNLLILVCGCPDSGRMPASPKHARLRDADSSFGCDGNANADAYRHSHADARAGADGHGRAARVEPDRTLAMTLGAKGRSLFVTSDLNGAEAAFIDADRRRPRLCAGPSGPDRCLPLSVAVLATGLAGRPKTRSRWRRRTARLWPTLRGQSRGAHHFDEAKELGLRAVELDAEKRDRAHGCGRHPCQHV